MSFIFQEGRTSSPSLSGPPVSSMMTPRSDDMMETKYSDMMDTKYQGPGHHDNHHYMDPHRSNMLLPLPTKSEVSQFLTDPVKYLVSDFIQFP